MTTETIQEHQRIPYNSDELQCVWKEGMRLPPQREGLDRWFFQWQWIKPWQCNDSEEDTTDNDGSYGYYASYVIGAQWLDKEKKSMPLVVTPKDGCESIDFLSMFSTCFKSGISAEDFSRIYGVDLDQPRIRAPQLKSVLSPLLVAHFLTVIEKIIRRGLKRDYVEIENNLRKVRGRIDIARNEQKNIIPKRYDRITCKHQEYSVNTPENRLLKKALLFSRQILYSTAISRSLEPLQQTVNQFLAFFHGIDDQIEVWEVSEIKHHKIFREYKEAVRLAQMILQRYDYSIARVGVSGEYTPVFWLDMSLLYEHYVYGLLKDAYGDKIQYQKCGYTGYPDFICYDPIIVMDTKYIPRFDKSNVDTYIARQLSAYSRDRRLFNDEPKENIPCLIIFPKVGEALNPFKKKSLFDLLTEEDKHLWQFYRIAVPLPSL